METIGIAGPVTLELIKEYLNVRGGDLPAGRGGTAIVHLTRELLQRGRQVILFTLDPSISRPICFEGSQLKVWIGPYRAVHRARDFFAVERHFLNGMITDEKPDIIHANWTYEYALAALTSGLPTVVTARDAPLRILRYDPSPYRFVRTLMALRTLHLAKHVCAVSMHVANHLKRVLHYKGELIVIPNGIPQEVFSLYEQTRQPKKNFVFASILNGWGGLKNGPILLQAFSDVNKRLSNSELWMFGIGHGPHEAAELWAKKKGLTRGVRFIGRINYSQLLRYLANDVDVLVHPSFEEGCPNTILEGLALGLPIIGRATSGGVSETLGFGQAGLLVEMNSPSALAHSMLELSIDGRKRSHFSEAGHAYALEHFPISGVVDQYEQVYATLR
jgi:glycosyltransferase involved in cell wall biosynthesis